MIDKKERSKIGKKNRASGARFELIVRKDLISKGWFVSKFQSNVEFPEEMKHVEGIIFPEVKNLFRFREGKLIPAKGNRFRARTLGFPDFIVWKTRFIFKFKKKVRHSLILNKDIEITNTPNIIGVEAKSNGYLDKIERAKCEWLLNNHVFSKILVASKIREGRKIKVRYGEITKDGKIIY